MLKCVSHMDMDAALQTEQLETALANLSYPFFCLINKKGVRSNVIMCRLLTIFSCWILYSHRYVSLYYFTFQVWYLKIVQLILEMLVAGTPPSSITAAIIAFVQNGAIDIVIKELPSIWFIRQCRTVLLITCQLLDEYCISKLEKWGTIQIDVTGHLKTAIINLIITISQANDPTFLPVLFSVSILPKDETAVGQHDAIVLFINEKRVGYRNGKM